MTTYESKQKQILKPQEQVFATLTNLKQLETYRDKIADNDKVKNIEFNDESISFEVEPMGRVEFRIIEKEAFKTIKFGADKFPIPISLWIQLHSVSESDTRMKLTVSADIPMMLKPMIGNKIGDGLEKMADFIATALNE